MSGVSYSKLFKAVRAPCPVRTCSTRRGRYCHRGERRTLHTRSASPLSLGVAIDIATGARFRELQPLAEELNQALLSMEQTLRLALCECHWYGCERKLRSLQRPVGEVRVDRERISSLRTAWGFQHRSQDRTAPISRRFDPCQNLILCLNTHIVYQLNIC